MRILKSFSTIVLVLLLYKTAFLQTDSMKITSKTFEEIIVFQIPDFYSQCSVSDKVLNCSIERNSILRWMSVEKEDLIKKLEFTENEFSFLMNDFNRYLKKKFRKEEIITIKKPCLYRTKDILNNMDLALYDLTRKYIEYALLNDEINLSYIIDSTQIVQIIKKTNVTFNDTIKYPGPNEKILVGTSTSKKYYTDDESCKIFSTGDFTPNDGYSRDIKNASFPGGEEKLQDYLKSHLRNVNAKGKFIVGFKVTKEGSIQNIKIIKGLDEMTNKAIVSVISNMPNWTPKETNGNKVDEQIVIPINL